MMNNTFREAKNMDNSISRTYKRRNYFIDKSFQSRFILKFCVLVGLGGLLTIALLYILALKSTTVSFVNSRVVVMSTADFILPILIQTVAVVLVIVGLATVFITLLVSHKIAGPLFRFKKVLEQLGEGDFSQDFHIRNLDQMQELADTFDGTIKQTRLKLSAVQDAVNSLKVSLNNISESEVAENKRAVLGELKKISEELDKHSRYFKTG